MAHCSFFRLNGFNRVSMIGYTGSISINQKVMKMMTGNSVPRMMDLLKCFETEESAWFII
jgi:hypothetical protein